MLYSSRSLDASCMQFWAIFITRNYPGSRRVLIDNGCIPGMVMHLLLPLPLFLMHMGDLKNKYHYIPTLLGTNISPPKTPLKMIFLFVRWDMLVSWRVDTTPATFMDNCFSNDFYAAWIDDRHSHRNYFDHWAFLGCCSGNACHVHVVS